MCTIALNKVKEALNFKASLKKLKAGDGNRTHVSSLEGWCSTIELHPHKYYLI